MKNFNDYLFEAGYDFGCFMFSSDSFRKYELSPIARIISSTTSQVANYIRSNPFAPMNRTRFYSPYEI